MAWTKADAEAFMSGSKTFEEIETPATSQPSEVSTDSPVDNVESTAANTDKAETSIESGVEEETSTSSDVTENPEKVESKPENKKGQKTYSAEEKQKHAFAKEKNKRKEVQSKLDAKLKEIEELKAKIAKYEGLTKENFSGDENAFTDYKIDQRFNKEKVDRLQKEYDSEEAIARREEAEQIAAYRLETNYPDEAERNKYTNLIMRAETDYASMHPEIGYSKFSEFLTSEKDKTILQYLQDSDNSPRLIRHFIHKPEAALKIMQMRNPYNKIVELKQLENRMLQHDRVVAAKAKVQAPQKQELPDTGKVVTNTTINNSMNWEKPMSRAEAEAYIASHKR